MARFRTQWMDYKVNERLVSDIDHLSFTPVAPFTNMV